MVAMKVLESKHADLEDKHSSTLREKELAYDQARELQVQSRTKSEEYKVSVKSHQLKTSSCEKQISSLQEKNQCTKEMLQQEQLKNLSASIRVANLENSLADEKDKKVLLFTECQKHAEANRFANMLTLQLMEEAGKLEEERKALLTHNEKLRGAILQQMKVLHICEDSVPADFTQDEVML